MEKLMKYGKRKSVLIQVINGFLTIDEASQQLNLSKRQIIRLKKKLQQNPYSPLIHGNPLRSLHNAFPKEIKSLIIKLYKSKYSSLNISHFRDPLSNNQISNKKRRKRRKPFSKEGQVVFLDGSIHKWFGDEESCLLLAVDDATKKPLCGFFAHRKP